MIKLYYTYSNPKSEAFIKCVLKEHCGKEEFEIKRTPNGKPYVDFGTEFSISHTEGLTVCAVSESTVGADTEKVRSIKNKEKILVRFTKEDVREISDKEFLEKWTAFESRVKYFGEKIADCPSVFEKNLFTKTIELADFIISVSSEKETEIVKENLNGSF